jgi:uncharacterized membrane protein
VIRKLLPWSMIIVWGIASLMIYLLAVGFGGVWLLRPPATANAPFYFQLEWYAIAATIVAPLVFAGLRLAYELFQKASRAQNS